MAVASANRFMTAVETACSSMASSHAVFSSLFFVLFGLFNQTSNAFYNSTSDARIQAKIWHGFHQGGNAIHDNEATLPYCHSGSNFATLFKRRFFRRRLFYSSNGTSSFNPMTLQIILSGDIHPQPGPALQKYQNAQFGRERRGTESTMTINQHANQSNIKIAHLNIRSLKFREHFILLQHTIEEHKFDIFTGWIHRWIVALCKYLAFNSSVRIVAITNLVAALAYTSEILSKLVVLKNCLLSATTISNNSGQKFRFERVNHLLYALFIDHQMLV